MRVLSVVSTANTQSQHAATIQQIGEHIARARHILILNPERGDGDSLGSTLALASHLANTKKEYTIFALNLASRMFAFLPRLEEVITRAEELPLEKADLIIAIDFADPKMTGVWSAIEAINRNRCPIVTIDHHPTHTRFGDLNFVDPSAAASAELLFQIFETHNWPIDHTIATCLLTGILTDTSNFANRNTTTLSFDIAAKLLRRGAKLKTITDFTFRNKSVGSLRLWGRALSRLQRNENMGLVTTYITQKDFVECDADSEATRGIANFLNSLAGAKAVLVLRELPGGRLDGSLRTTGDDFDVAQLAAQFGGGGHRRAAGFTIPGRIETLNGRWRIV